MREIIQFSGEPRYLFTIHEGCLGTPAYLLVRRTLGALFFFFFFGWKHSLGIDNFVTWLEKNPTFLKNTLFQRD